MKTNKYDTWFFHYSGMSYAENIYLDKPGTVKDAKEYIRHMLGLKRLPNNTSVYPKIENSYQYKSTLPASHSYLDLG